MSNPTDVTAPDTTPTDTTAADQTTAAAVTTTEGSDEGGAPADLNPPDPDAAALAAFDKGLEQSGTAPRTAADVAAQAAAPTPAGTATPAAPAGAAAPAAPAAATPPEPDPETDKAVKELGLKGRAEERFREMAGTIKDLEPLREAFAKHNITDVSKVQDVLDSAARGIEWENTVMSSTATPEQFGSALNVIRAMNSDDPKLQNIAFDAMLGEVVNLGKRLGREVAGLVDPLEAHPDLQDEVNGGDLTRKRALEIAAQRATAARVDERDTERNTQRQHQEAIDTAMVGIQQLNDQIKATDPDFARKLPLLQPALNLITSTVHPTRWVEAVRKAYSELPAMTAAPAPAPVPPPASPRPPVGHMPVRPGGMNAGMQAKPKTDLEAFEMGLKSVQRD